MANTKTIVINNFNGRLTRFRDGDMNSGMANFYSSWGYDAFQLSGTLSFIAAPTSIKGSVITDMVVAGKERVENNITYCYCIGHTGRLYKIQVNNPSTNNPDYDNPVLVTTLTNAQTFKYGGSLDFYQGSGTEKIWIGHDTGMTKINFDGTGETNLASSWTGNVPRQQVQFGGVIYITDGSNLAKIDSTETVITHTAISPGFPANTTARDLRITPDGRYLVTVVTRNAPGDMTQNTPNLGDIACMPSYLMYWNGTDTAVSSFTQYPAFSMNAYYAFSSYEYLFGYQIGGCMLGTPQSVILVDEFVNPPMPNAIASSGDFLGWTSTVFNTITGHTDAIFELYGTIDSETPKGHYRQYRMSSSLTGGDILRLPFYTPISSFATAGSTSGYTTAPFQNFGTGKAYFSTIEYDGNTTKYDFYRFKNVLDYLAAAGAGIYETQHQFFPKKVKATEVRVYLEPSTSYASQAFSIQLIGIDGNAIAGTTATFSGANQLTSATVDRVKSNPRMAPSSYIGVRLINAGVVTPLIHRVEVDVEEFGN